MHLYWNTLRYNRKNFTDEGKSLKNRFWHKGMCLAAVLTARCNFHCSYCPMFLSDKKYPRFDECTLEDWINYFTKFPEWLSQIFITGGEPTLLPWLADLINFLTRRGHHVCLFSNLAIVENLFRIEKTFKFVLIPTFHPEYDSAERFKFAMKRLEGRFRILPQEMESEHKLDITRHKDKFKDQWWYDENFLIHVPPDAPRTGKLFFGCHRAYMEGKK